MPGTSSSERLLEYLFAALIKDRQKRAGRAVEPAFFLQSFGDLTSERSRGLVIGTRFLLTLHDLVFVQQLENKFAHGPSISGPFNRSRSGFEQSSGAAPADGGDRCSPRRDYQRALHRTKQHRPASFPLP